MSGDFNPLDHPVVFSTPRFLTHDSAWREHIPFGMLVVDLLRPETIVELGTESGDSYSAFCQAVDELGLDTRCHSIATWTGDPATGTRDPEILAHLRSHHDPLYSRFSRLVDGSSDAALAEFGDETVDLLHIDGSHSYEHLRHDFDSWLPKVADHGVVLLRNTNATDGPSGSHRLWTEVRDAYPSFELVHGEGLGLIAIGQPRPGVDALTKAEGEELDSIRRFLFALGHLSSELAQFRAPGAGEQAPRAGLARERDESVELLAKALDFISRMDAERATQLLAFKELEATNDRLRLESRKDAIARNRKLRKLRAAHARQMNAIFQSRSWRLTRPLRALRSLMRGKGPTGW